MTDRLAEVSAAILCRRLIRAAERAVLATVAGRGKGGIGGPWPFASLVLVACDTDASPLMLISDLAEHARNLRADPRVSLLYDGTAGLDDPLAGPRATLQGEAEELEDDALMNRYLRRYPHARTYATFADFHLVRVRPVRAHLVAGFGKIDWVEGGELAFDTTPAKALCAAERDLVDNINSSASDVLDQIAPPIAGRRRSGWQAIGIDPEGIDLRCGTSLARVDFPKTITSNELAMETVAQLAAATREA